VNQWFARGLKYRGILDSDFMIFARSLGAQMEIVLQSTGEEEFFINHRKRERKTFHSSEILMKAAH
jgi:hypothetical protein